MNLQNIRTFNIITNDFYKGQLTHQIAFDGSRLEQWAALRWPEIDFVNQCAGEFGHFLASQCFQVTRQAGE